MRSAILRALVFAGAVTGASLAMDLVYTAFQQGAPYRGLTREFAVFRLALHGATLVMTLAGALVGFALARSCEVALARIATLGVFLGVATLAALLVAFRVAGFWGMAAWLLLSGALVSYAGARLLGTRAGPTR